MHNEQGMMNKECTVYQMLCWDDINTGHWRNDTIAGQLNIQYLCMQLMLRRKLVIQHIILIIQTRSNIVFCCFNTIKLIPKILYHEKVNLILSTHGIEQFYLHTATTQEFGILGLKLTSPELRVTSSWIALAPFYPFTMDSSVGVVSGRFGLLACLVPCFRFDEWFLGNFRGLFWTTHASHFIHLANW